ncbi:4-(cytidine 5'-diphospho)-2-C-methyl-D-erythritol kinase [Psychrobacter halodurans]|uniref:4-diphosphocytidyl-2-C-methyl-D-erythritol kinase n=1 Tax=Psychrobacter halodurans TaxID=2818439 RepID=A0AAW4IQM0_9GAMM|nr:4-(cytidine 5'-diphospho)-2-C-methyl-D-erythritol kinase [Psychrobacter halodurans]MBO1517461.1 4-(cytidine 5'-diphospho)-2-C-methyl-D-erythritol kinase [Psychrobacter halodurans]
MIENIAASSASTMTRLSPAKLNLFLHITGKRADGYHDLQTVFRLLDWGDYLHFSLVDGLVDIDSTLAIDQLCERLLKLTGAEAITSHVTDNLIFQAARALLAAAIASNKLSKQLAPVTIELDKHLPMGAGLGGGSSNAATTLLALNEIWAFDFSQDEMINIGATVGADVPIFIFGQDAIAQGIGEQLTPIALPDQQYLVLTPTAHVSTAELFTHPTLQRDIIPLSIPTIKRQAAHYTQALHAPYHNVFTPVVTGLAPAVDDALQYLQVLETVARSTARMTGSGSAVFLPLDASIATDKALIKKWLANAPCPAYLVDNL